MRTIVTVILLMTSTAAFAGGSTHHNTTGGNTSVNNTNVNLNNASSHSSSRSSASARATSRSSSRAASSSNNAVSFRDRRQAPVVVAPGLVAGASTCLGSTSVAGSGPGFGFSFGGTHRDEGCHTRANSDQLLKIGNRRAATEVLCNDPQMFNALAATGYRCRIVPEGYKVITR